MIYVREESNHKRKIKIPRIVKIKEPNGLLVNIRSEPDATKENVVKIVPSGTEFREVSDEGTDEFVAISIVGTTCYVMRKFVDIFDDPAYVANQFERTL